MINNQESTYALLVRSEERSRSALEGLAYSTLLLSLAVAIAQFAQHPVNIPAPGMKPEVARIVTTANIPS